MRSWPLIALGAGIVAGVTGFLLLWGGFAHFDCLQNPPRLPNDVDLICTDFGPSWGNLLLAAGAAMLLLASWLLFIWHARRSRKLR